MERTLGVEARPSVDFCMRRIAGERYRFNVGLITILFD